MREVIADVNVAFGINRCGSRANKCCLLGRAINVVFDAAAGDGGHGVGRHIKFANLSVMPIGNDEISVSVACNAGGEKERRLQRRAVFFSAAACNGRYNSVRRHSANAAVKKVRNHQIALGIEGCLRSCAGKAERSGRALTVGVTIHVTGDR